MKKTLTTCLLCGCLAIGSAFAQNTQKPDVNRVSFGAKWGVNYLLLSNRTTFSTNTVPNPTFGAYFEVSANPIWSAGIEYVYMNNCQGIKGAQHLEAAIQNITYYNSINITNVVAKRRSTGWQKFNVFGTLGGGLGIYSYQPVSKTEDGEKIKGEKVTGADQVVIMSALSMEYNFTKSIALGIESHFRYNPDVRFLAEYKGAANLCGIHLTGRIKLGGAKNLHNMSWNDYKPCVPVVPAANNSAVLNQQKQQLNTLDGNVSNHQDDIETMQRQVKELQEKLQ